MLERAGRDALQVGAIAAARRHAGAAVELAGDTASPGLLMFRAETMLAAGDVAAAIPMYRRILDRPEIEAGARGLAQRRLAVGLYVAGQARDLDLELEAAFRAASEEPSQAVQALLDISAVHWLTRGPGRGLDYARRGRDLAHNSGSALEARADAAWGFCAYQCGDPAGLAALEAAARTAERDPVADLSNLDWSWGTLGMYVAVADFAERFTEADRVFGIAFDAAERIGTPMSIVALSLIRGGGLVRTGRLTEALELAEQSDILLDLTPALLPWSTWLHALILAELGRTEESRQACHRLSDQLGSDLERLPLLRLWLCHLEAIVLRREGDLEEACPLYEQAERIAEAARIAEPCIVPWAGDAALTYLAAGRAADAERVLAWLEKAAAVHECRWPRIAAGLVRAALAEAENLPAKAEQHYEQALSLHAGLAMPLAEARTLLAYGTFLRRRSEPRRARPPFARALELAESCGAASLAEDAGRELAAAGGRRLRKVNADELTPQESRVADLAARGLSNEHIARALVVSVKTVETHLHHVYDKLAIGSRRELILKMAQPR
jgi:DNA-binding CsgD family transcriptional regulator